jgi:putative peptidoglycan lipid II flippase
MFRVFRSEKKDTVFSPERAATMFAFFTLLATVLGILRERILASVIGPGVVLDAYALAHKIPDFLYATTATMVASTILLPYLVQRYGRAEQHRFLSQIYTVFSVGTVIICLILIVLCPVIIPILGPGFAPETVHMAVRMTQILLISPLLMGTGNILGSALQLEKRFFAISLAPLLYNLGTLIAMYIGYPLIGYAALPIGIVVGALCHMTIQRIMVNPSLSPHIVSRIQWPVIRHMFLTSIPRTFSASTAAITSLGIVTFGSYLASGSVSLINFALIIQNVPITLVGLAMSVASFPVLVELFASGDRSGFSARLIHSARIIVLIALPLSALFFVLSYSAITLLFHSGQFDTGHSYTTALLVSVLSISVTAQSLIQLGVRAYYAQNNTWRPFFQNLIALVFTFLFAGIFFVTGYNSLVMLVLSLVLGSLANVVIMWKHIFAESVTATDKKSFFAALKISIAAALWMYIVGYICLHYLVLSADMSKLTLFVYTSVTASIMLAVAVAMYWLLNIPEIQLLKNKLGYK